MGKYKKKDPVKKQTRVVYCVMCKGVDCFTQNKEDVSITRRASRVLWMGMGMLRAPHWEYIYIHIYIRAGYTINTVGRPPKRVPGWQEVDASRVACLKQTCSFFRGRGGGVEYRDTVVIILFLKWATDSFGQWSRWDPEPFLRHRLSTCIPGTSEPTLILKWTHSKWYQTSPSFSREGLGAIKHSPFASSCWEVNREIQQCWFVPGQRKEKKDITAW